MIISPPKPTDSLVTHSFTDSVLYRANVLRHLKGMCCRSCGGHYNSSVAMFRVLLLTSNKTKTLENTVQEEHFTAFIFAVSFPVEHE